MKNISEVQRADILVASDERFAKAHPGEGRVLRSLAFVSGTAAEEAAFLVQNPTAPEGARVTQKLLIQAQYLFQRVEAGALEGYRPLSVDERESLRGGIALVHVLLTRGALMAHKEVASVFVEESLHPGGISSIVRSLSGLAAASAPARKPAAAQQPESDQSRAPFRGAQGGGRGRGRGRVLEGRVCFGCQQPGHQIAQCPLARGPVPPGPPPAFPQGFPQLGSVLPGVNPFAGLPRPPVGPPGAGSQ